MVDTFSRWIGREHAIDDMLLHLSRLVKIENGGDKLKEAMWNKSRYERIIAKLQILDQLVRALDSLYSVHS